MKLKNVSDTTLALLVGFAGAASMAVGVSMHRNPFSALPGYDGAIAMGILGFAFALLHGVPYRKVLLAMAPILAIQIVGGQRYQASVFALVGLELALFGVAGLVMSALYHRSLRAKTELKGGPRGTPAAIKF